MATRTELSKLFVALFNRAIDSSILNQYSEQTFNAALIGRIIDDKDASLRDMTNQQFVEHFYKNALGKTIANDKAGIDFWVKEMTDKKWTKEQFVESIIAEVENYTSGRKPSTSIDRAGTTVWSAKIEISDEAAQKVGGADAFYLTFGAGLPEITAANATTSKTAALETITEVALRDPAPISGGNTVALTLENPNFLPPAQGQSGSATTATKADDTINAIVDGANSTLRPTSRIDAAEGSDTLKVEMKTDFGGLQGSGSITNVEHIDLTNTANNPLTFNAQGIKGVYTYGLIGSNSVNLNNVEYNKGLGIAIEGAKNPSTSITFQSGTPRDATLDLLLADVGAAGADNAHTINVNGISKLKLAFSGKNWANFGTEGGTDSITSIIAGGSGSLITTLASSVNTFNGSGFTGDVTLTATATSGGSINIKTGSGNDRVTVDIGRIKSNNAIDLGTGNDTLTFTGTSNNNTRQYWDLSSVETLVFNNTNSGSTVLALDLGTQRPGNLGQTITEGDRSANLKVLTFGNGASTTLTGLGKKDLVVNYGGGTQTQAVSLDHEGTTTLFFKGAGASGAGDITLGNTTSVKLNLDGQSFSGNLSLSKATQLDITNLTASNAFVLGSGSDLTALKTLNLTSESGNIRSVVSVGNAKLAALENVNLVGAGSFALGALSNASGDITIDGARHVGSLNIGTIDADKNAVKLTSAGSVTTGIITGANVDIDLSKATSNRLDDIRLSDNGTQAILVYKTHQGNATQAVQVNAPKASLTLTGQGGNDNFEIVASSVTDEIILAGNLGAGRDTVSVDLTKTQGTKVDTSNLTLAQTAFGVDISLSKGQDTITLGSSSETIKLKAGQNNGDGANEAATFTATALGIGNSLTINGKTITALAAQTATAVATAVNNVLQGNAAGTGFAETGELRGNIAGDWTITASNSMLTFTAKQVGDVRDLSEVLTVDSGPAVSAAQNITIAAAAKTTAVDSVTSATGANATASLSAAFSGANASAGALSTDPLQEASASAGTVVYSITGLSGVHEISIKSAASQKVSGTNAAKVVAAVLEGVALTGVNSMNVAEVKIKATSTGSFGSDLVSSNNLTATGNDLTGTGWKVEADASTGKLKLSPDSATVATAYSGGNITVAEKSGTSDAKTLTIAPGTAATQATKFIKVEGLKTSATAAATNAEIEITSKPGNGTVTPTQVAKIVIAAIEGTALASASLGNVSEVTLNGTAITTMGTTNMKIEARPSADLTGGGWKLEQVATSGGTNEDKLKISTVGTATSIEYGMNLTFKVGANSGGATNVSGTELAAKGVTSGTKGALTVTFNELKQGQYYTFDGKTVVALQDATAGEVAKAFAGDVDASKLAASGSFTNLTLGNMATQFTATASGASVIFEQGAIGASNATTINGTIDTVAGAGVTGGGSSTGSVNIATTTQGVAAGLENADSYVVLMGGAGSSTVASNYVISTNSKMDTISNFNVGTDKVSLTKVGAGATGKIGQADFLAANDLSTSLDNVFVNAAGGPKALTGDIENGFMTFKVAGAGAGTTVVANATLGQKLGALSKIATNKVVAFKDGTDVYIVAGGGDATANRDDAVIKLAGIANSVNNLADLLG